jgi:hypothetical protein
LTCHSRIRARISGSSLRSGSLALRIRLVERRAVPVQHAQPHLERVARDADQPLHDLQVLLDRIEDDDVAARRLAHRREPLAGEGDLGAVQELVHEEEVADQQRPLCIDPEGMRNASMTKVRTT